ncbi:MAG: hypothetical protein ACE361_19455 [Aureliella sp.]
MSERVPDAGYPSAMEPLPEGVSRDRYCSPRVSLETCEALLIELEPLSDLRFEYMFWRGLCTSPPMKSETKPRLRDLRPGDEVVVEGFRRIVRVVKVFR